MEWLLNYNDVFVFLNEWWITSTLLCVALLWGLELLYRGLSNDRADARPFFNVILSAVSLGYMFHTMLWYEQGYTYIPMWRVLKGPIMHICIIRYLYGCIRRPTVAAGRTMHIWMILAIIHVASFTIGSKTLEQRQEMAYAGLPVDDFNFTPVLHFIWIFEIMDLVSALYVWYIIPYIRHETTISAARNTTPHYMVYASFHWAISWAWMTTRVIGFGAITVVSSLAVSGIIARLYFGIITASQFSLWWDFQNVAPHALHHMWMWRVSRFAKR